MNSAVGLHRPVLNSGVVPCNLTCLQCIFLAQNQIFKPQSHECSNVGRWYLPASKSYLQHTWYFVAVRADFGRPRTADLAVSRRACFIDTSTNLLNGSALPVFEAIYTHYCLRSEALLTKCLVSQFIFNRYLANNNCIDKLTTNVRNTLKVRNFPMPHRTLQFLEIS